MLERADGLRRPNVFLTPDAISEITTDIQVAAIDRRVAIRRCVAAFRFFRDFSQTRAFDLRRSAGKIILDEFAR